MNQSGDEEKRRFGRPWEGGDDDPAEVFLLQVAEDDDPADPTPASHGEAVGSPDEAVEPQPPDDGDDVDLTDWETMVGSDSDDDRLSAEAYATATTMEYRGLAEDVSRAAEEEWQLQAVAATVPGVGSGLVGFEDVTGLVANPEEHYEASEQAATSDLAMRMASALIIFGMFLGSLFLGGWWFTGFLVLLMIVGAGEFYAAVRAAGHTPLALFGLVGVAVMGVLAHVSGVGALAGAVSWVAAATILYYAIVPRRAPLTGVSLTIVGMAWVGLLSFAVLIALGPKPLENILFLVLLVAFNDIGAYFVGRAIGRRKLAPVISPHKTVAGFIGGLVASLAVSAVLTTFPGWEQIGFTRGLIIAAVIGVVAPIGDAIESLIKRTMGMKDMGAVLPGHGGILDRIDGFILGVPVVYYLLRGFGLL